MITRVSKTFSYVSVRHVLPWVIEWLESSQSNHYSVVFHGFHGFNIKSPIVSLVSNNQFLVLWGGLFRLLTRTTSEVTSDCLFSWLLYFPVVWVLIILLTQGSLNHNCLQFSLGLPSPFPFNQSEKIHIPNAKCQIGNRESRISAPISLPDNGEGARHDRGGQVDKQENYS